MHVVSCRYVLVLGAAGSACEKCNSGAQPLAATCPLGGWHGPAGADVARRDAGGRFPDGRTGAVKAMRTNGDGRGRTVVITGASAGVGRAVARAFGRRGDRVALLARGIDGLEGAAAEIRASGGTAIVLPTDIADAGQVEAAADEAERALGPIDIWVNNAMVTVLAPVWETTPEEYARVTAVTYLGAVHGTQAALRRMRPRDQGVILQVGSVLAYRGIPLQSAYCGAKHALQGFCDSLWSELKHEGSRIRMTMIHLPGLNTPQFDWARTRLPNRPQPVPPIYQPEVAADAIVWAADHDRREITVGAQATAILWGNKLLPRLGDWYLGRTGVEGQQTDEPIEPDRPDNLFEPAAGDWGARGRFDARAHDHSLQLAMNKHLGALLVAGVAGAAAILLARRR